MLIVAVMFQTTHPPPRPEEEGRGNKEKGGWKGEEGEGVEDTSRQRQDSSSSHSPPTDTEDNTYMGFDERYQQRMAAEFEAEFEADFQQDGDSEFMSQQPERSREVRPTPSDPRLIDISATEGLVSQAEEEEHSDTEEYTSGGEEGEGRGVKSQKGHKVEEVEEGEVSDSSSGAESASEADQVGLGVELNLVVAILLLLSWCFVILLD